MLFLKKSQKQIRIKKQTYFELELLKVVPFYQIQSYEKKNSKKILFISSET